MGLEGVVLGDLTMYNVHNGQWGIREVLGDLTMYISVGASSQCYWDELMLLKCELILLNARSTQIRIKMNF